MQGARVTATVTARAAMARTSMERSSTPPPGKRGSDCALREGRHQAIARLVRVHAVAGQR
jgi:hypothetical protein